MDAHKLSETNIKEAIKNGNYELTGILETGEIRIAIVSDLEKEIIEKSLMLQSKDAKEFIRKYMEVTDNTDIGGLLEVYKQLSVTDKSNICLKNNLRIRE